jgi:hypothetical protein
MKKILIIWMSLIIAPLQAMDSGNKNDLSRRCSKICAECCVGSFMLIGGIYQSIVKATSPWHYWKMRAERDNWYFEHHKKMEIRLRKEHQARIKNEVRIAVPQLPDGVAGLVSEYADNYMDKKDFQDFKID